MNSKRRVGPIVLVLVASTLAGGVGCAPSRGARSRPPPRPEGVAPFDRLHLLTSPTGLNLDRSPGADGFHAKVYAGRLDYPKMVEIDSGRLELSIYDGVVDVPVPETVEPRETWTYTAAQLDAGTDGLTSTHGYDPVLGHVYRFTVLWSKERPMPRELTIVARWLPEAGAPPIAAPPVTLRVRLP